MIEKAPFCCIPLFDAKNIALISGRSEKSSDIRSALTFSKPERWSICNTFSAKYRERDRNTLKQERFNLCTNLITCVPKSIDRVISLESPGTIGDVCRNKTISAFFLFSSWTGLLYLDADGSLNNIGLKAG